MTTERPLSEILSEIDPNFQSGLTDFLSVHHVLKAWPICFQPMKAGLKNFDVRKKEEDRHFDVHQYIILREWSPSLKEYTGEWALYHIKYILHGEVLKPFGIELDADILGLIHVSGS